MMKKRTLTTCCSQKKQMPGYGGVRSHDARYFPCLTCSLGPPVARSARTCWSRWFASWRMEPWIYQPLGGGPVHVDGETDCVKGEAMEK